MMPNVQSSATATGGKASNGTIIIKFHLLVGTEGAVAVGCSDLLGCSFARSKVCATSLSKFVVSSGVQKHSEKSPQSWWTSFVRPCVVNWSTPQTKLRTSR